MSNHTNHQVAAPSGLTGGKLMIVLGLMLAAFFTAYNVAQAKSATPAAAGAPGATSALAGAGGGCCGGGGAPVEGTAALSGDVQKISVDTSAGTFNPNVIKVKAGVPVEIAFSQSAGGCLSGVVIPDFQISEDLTAGGKTVKLPALQPGTYQFSCQMGMVQGQIVAE